MIDFSGPLSLRGLQRTADQAAALGRLSGTGVGVDLIGGAPILTAVPGVSRSCTARITGIALESDGVTPLLDDNGAQQYTWIEEQRIIDGSGFPQWQDVPAASTPRQSVLINPGQYLNLAHEANGQQAAAGDHVIVWAGVTNAANSGDIEHVFYASPFPLNFAVFNPSPGSSSAPMTFTNFSSTWPTGEGVYIDAMNSAQIDVQNLGIYLIILEINVNTSAQSPPFAYQFQVEEVLNDSVGGLSTIGAAIDHCHASGEISLPVFAGGGGNCILPDLNSPGSGATHVSISSIVKINPASSLSISLQGVNGMYDSSLGTVASAFLFVAQLG
jgi:hypothetical protein